MSAYSATYLAELTIVPFDFGNSGVNGPRPWRPGRQTAMEPAVEETMPAPELEPEEKVDPWEAREAELLLEAESAYARGHEDAQLEAEEQIEETSLRLAQTVERLNAMVAELKSRFRTDAVELASNLARAAVSDLSVPSSEMLINVVERALGMVEDTHDIRILCHPEDVKVIERHMPAMEERRGGLPALRIIADAGVERGGCIIQHASGTVDAQPSVTIDVLSAAIKAELSTYESNSEDND